MKFSKIVSAVSALTLAASAFVGLAVTADAALAAGTYTSTVSPAATNRITNNGDGTFTSASNAGNQYALAIADLSGVEDISRATSVTVEFDTLNAGRFIVGIGDKSTRGTNANSSSKSTYNTEGLIMRFGTTDGSSYRVNGGTSNSGAMNSTVHASVTLDRVNDKYSYTLTSSDGATTYFSGSDTSTDVDNLTIVEAYTWANSSTFTFSDVSVSYVIPDAEQVTCTLNAIDSNGTILKESIASKTSDADSTVSITGIPYAVPGSDGTYYTLSDSDVTNYAKKVTLPSTGSSTETVTYAASDYVYYAEGETLGTVTTSGDTYSSGAYGAVAGSKTASIGTYPSGTYTLTFYLAEAANRGMYVRNTAVSDTTENIIATASIDKNSSAGIYTVDFTLTEETVLGVSGYTNSQGKINQSAGFDYLYLQKTGDVYAITATNTESATVTVDKTAAAEGDTVTVTATAADGYENPVITVTTASGTAVTVTTASGTAVTVTDGTFTMPAEAVTVTATATAAETTDPTYEAVNVGTYEGNTAEGTDDGTDATAFVVDIVPAGTTVSVSKFTVTSGGTSKEYTTGTGTDDTMTTLPTITGGSEYTFGVIVDNLLDSEAVLTLTLE